jgi:predicted hydrocarbon binding protein
LLDWAVKDSKELIVCHPVPNDDNPFKGDDVCIWINNNAMATSMYDLAQEAWNRSLDPVKFDPGEVMLNSAHRWFRLKNFKIDKVKIAKDMAKSIAESVGDKLQVKNLEDMAKKLVLFWRQNDLGKITIKKKKPLVLTFENKVDCQYKLYGGKPHCPFAEYFLKVLLEYKLGVKSETIVRKCKSAGDKSCEIEIAIDKRSSS